MHHETSIFFVTGRAALPVVFLRPKKNTAQPPVSKADSAVLAKAPADSPVLKKHSPHKATMHSLILPGWGQAYNRKYWKIPIIYAALGITGVVFNFNRVEYNKTKYAYFYVINRGTADSNVFQLSKVDPELLSFVNANDSYSLQLYRNEYRKNIDYSVLFFLFFWALNVVDATVDGHLKDFDITNDLSMHIKPTFISMPGAGLPGISVVLDIGKRPPKQRAFELP